MNEYRNSISMLINFCLVALLGAAWATSYFPKWAAMITLVSISGTILVAFLVPIISKSNATERDTTLPVANAFNDLQNIDNDTPTDKFEEILPSDWSEILQKWNDPHEEVLNQTSSIRNVIRKAVLEERNRSEKNVVINIGAINLVTRNHFTSIKIAGRENEKNYKDRKIDILLLPGSHDEVFK